MRAASEIVPASQLWRKSTKSNYRCEVDQSMISLVSQPTRGSGRQCRWYIHKRLIQERPIFVVVSFELDEIFDNTR